MEIWNRTVAPPAGRFEVHTAWHIERESTKYKSILFDSISIKRNNVICFDMCSFALYLIWYFNICSGPVIAQACYVGSVRMDEIMVEQTHAILVRLWLRATHIEPQNVFGRKIEIETVAACERCHLYSGNWYRSVRCPNSTRAGCAPVECAMRSYTEHGGHWR